MRKSCLIFFILLLFYLVIKDWAEYWGVFNYYLYFFPLLFLGFLALQDFIHAATNKAWFGVIAFVFGLYVIKDLARVDYNGVLDQVKFFLGFLLIFLFSSKYPLRQDGVRYLILIFVIMSVFYAAFSPLSRIELIPLPENGYHVFLGSIHYQGKFLVFVLLAMLWKYYGKFPIYKLNLLEVFSISTVIVLIILSGSRTSLLASLFMLAALFLYRNRRLGWGGMILVMFFMMVAYIGPVVLDSIVLPGYIGVVTKMNEVRDISAGRAWLQAYHLSLFFDNYILGAPENYFTFKIGDIVDGEIAKAGSESMYTKYLAREGLFGAVKILMFFSMVVYPVLRNDFFGFLVGGVIVLMNATLSLTNNPYSMFAIFYLWLYFSAVIDHGKRLYFVDNIAMKSRIS